MKTARNLCLLLLLLLALAPSAHAGEDVSPPLSTYTDPISGAILPIPECLHLVESGTEDNRSYAMFSFNEEGAPLIRYTCEDVWSKLPRKERFFLSRKDANTAHYHYHYDIEKDYGVHFLNVSYTRWSKWSSIRVDIPENTKLPNGRVTSIPSTVFLVYHRGYRHEFWIADDGESEYLPAMEELARFVIYTNDSESSDHAYSVMFVFSLLATFVSCQIFRLSIKQAGKITKKTRRWSVLHGFVAFSLFIPGGMAVRRILGSNIELFFCGLFFLLYYFPTYPGKKKHLPNRIILLPSLSLVTHHRIFLFVNAVLFLWQGFSQTELLCFGTEVLLLSLSCALPAFIYRSSLRENFQMDLTAKKRAHLRGALIYLFIALISWLLRLFLPVSLLFLLFSAGFHLLPLTGLHGSTNPSAETQTPLS